MAPRLQILMSSGPKKKRNRNMHFLSLSKCPIKRTPSILPNKAPMWTAFRLLGLLYTSLKFIIKIFLRSKRFNSKQHKWNALLRVFVNAVQLYVVDSHVYTKVDGKGKYCCVTNVIVVTRTRHNVMSCIHFLSCYTTQCKCNGRLDS